MAMLKGACPSCGEIVVVEPQTKPCECGLTQEVRIARAIAFAFVCVLIVAFGGCWLSYYYQTEQVKALPEKFQIAPNFGFGPGDHHVVPKPEPKQ